MNCTNDPRLCVDCERPLASVDNNAVCMRPDCRRYGLTSVTWKTKAGGTVEAVLTDERIRELQNPARNGPVVVSMALEIERLRGDYIRVGKLLDDARYDLILAEGKATASLRSELEGTGLEL